MNHYRLEILRYPSNSTPKWFRFSHHETIESARAEWVRQMASNGWEKDIRLRIVEIKTGLPVT